MGEIAYENEAGKGLGNFNEAWKIFGRIMWYKN